MEMVESTFTAIDIDLTPIGNDRMERRRRAAQPPGGAMRGVTQQGLANALGWFSVGLGLAELLAPRRLARSIGVPERTGLIRAMGLRGLTSGIGILGEQQSAGWLWSRVGGDFIDLALLGAALGADRNNKNRVSAATAMVVGVTLLDLLASADTSRRQTEGGMGRQLAGPSSDGIRLTKAITIRRAPDDLYQYWRRLENLPRIMRHVESVDVVDEKLSHWVARGPAGTKIEWDAEITADQPNQLIEWRSLPGASVDNAGVVRFEPAPGGRGTEVRVKLHYLPPAGVVGATVAKLLGEDPNMTIQEDLRRFKQFMETGDVALSDATIDGSHVSKRPAQPSEEAAS